jgi:cytochrome oxidase Cu insertion factor (SCO1/SenC/PrrC family)
MRTLLSLTLVLAASASTLAQPKERPRAADGRSFGARPAPGEMLPDVTVYDAAGKEFPLRSLRGRYTVLVFGCLT